MPRHSGERGRGDDDEEEERDHSARGRAPPRGDDESGHGDPRRADEEGHRRGRGRGSPRGDIEADHRDALREDEEGDRVQGGHGDALRTDEEGHGSRSGRGLPGGDIEGGHGGPRRADAEGRSERLGADNVRLHALNPELHDFESDRSEDPRADGLLVLNMTTGRRNASAAIAAEEGGEAEAEADAIEKERMDAHAEEGMDAADRGGLLFTAAAIILAMVLAAEAVTFAVVAFEAGAFAGALGAADGDEAGRDDWRAADEARALADAILAAEGYEAGEAAGAIEEEVQCRRGWERTITGRSSSRPLARVGAAFPSYVADHLFLGGTSIAGSTGHLNHFTPGIYTNLHQLEQEGPRVLWFARRQVYQTGWGTIFVTLALYLLHFQPMLGVVDLVLFLWIVLLVLVLLFV
ncbi:hypothetical protein EJB05_00142, partial [Eragrostis curvula]